MSHSRSSRCAIAALACLLFATTVSSVWLALSLSSQNPPTAQIGESSRGGSAPADKIQRNASSDLGFVGVPVVLLSPLPEPGVLPVAWREIGADLPGHSQRIDRPPRQV
jgi:hypothetical protein